MFVPHNEDRDRTPRKTMRCSVLAPLGPSRYSPGPKWASWAANPLLGAASRHRQRPSSGHPRSDKKRSQMKPTLAGPNVSTVVGPTLAGAKCLSCRWAIVRLFIRRGKEGCQRALMAARQTIQGKGLPTSLPEGKKMLVCVSRGQGSLTLNL